MGGCSSTVTLKPTELTEIRKPDWWLLARQPQERMTHTMSYDALRSLQEWSESRLGWLRLQPELREARNDSSTINSLFHLLASRRSHDVRSADKRSVYPSLVGGLMETYLTWIAICAVAFLIGMLA